MITMDTMKGLGNTYMENSLNNLTQGVPELAKNSTVTFCLEGWLAAAVLISIPASLVLVYAKKLLQQTDLKIKMSMNRYEAYDIS
ncbi:hypothetical protein [Lacrimispora amygdalina]|uniref:hypothetical protein n=1 Tax=Lacrimispora amygdalina TaxID=253257 RepID=UPI0014096854|nr:hypothetical protein [Lacrimispora amygdalina]